MDALLTAFVGTVLTLLSDVPQWMSWCGGCILKGDNIAQRLSGIAARSILIARRLPRDDAGRHLSDQLTRAATSSASHYAEARSAGTAKAFIYKLNLASGELRETDNCLDIASKTHDDLPRDEINSLRAECGELTAILVASIRTAQRNRAKKKAEAKQQRSK